MAKRFVTVTVAACALLLAGVLAGCGATPSSSGGQSVPFKPAFHTVSFDEAAAARDEFNVIDTSHAAEGYFVATTTQEGKLKLQVQNGDESYNYDLVAQAEPLVVPVNMGDGTYTLRVMQNTEANRYIELFSTTAEVVLNSEFEPFIRPNVFCVYSETSASTQLAEQLCADAATEGEAFEAICAYVHDNISYDSEKAARLKEITGYVPDPDATIASGTGICFDYASLMAAMLRSQGIPCKIITGYVSPDNIYHAWDMIYLNGSWSSLHISAHDGNWARVDMTFAATGAGDTIGDGSEYSERYVY